MRSGPKVYFASCYSDHLCPKIVQIGPVVQAVEQFSLMLSEREQTFNGKCIRKVT